MTDAVCLGSGRIRCQAHPIRAIHRSLPGNREGGAVLTQAAAPCHDNGVAGAGSISTILKQFREAKGEGARALSLLGSGPQVREQDETRVIGGEEESACFCLSL